MTWNPPALTKTRITLTDPIVVSDPAGFAARWLDATAIAVVERRAEVLIVPFRDVAFDDGTVYVHAFSEASRADVRAVRVTDGWLVDAVREDATSADGHPALCRPGRHLCLGKAVPTKSSGTTMQEGRIRPYTLPIAVAAEANAFVEYLDYYAEDETTGDLHCFAHRVVAIRSLEHD